METGEQRETLIRLCQELVRCPSVSGEERSVASLLGKKMLSCGFDRADVDGLGNVVGLVRFSKPGKTLLYEAQMDHVSVGDLESWTHYPFEAARENDRIYGRGTSDQKGSLSAMILAASLLKQERSADLSGELLIAATVQQESFEGVASSIIARNYSPDFVVVTEASGLRVERGQRGRAEISLETAGRMAHTAHPSLGINAASKMIKLLGTLESVFVPQVDPFFGEGHLVLTNLISLPQPNASVISDRCRATLDRRLNDKESRESVLEQIRQTINALSLLDPQLKAFADLSSQEGRSYTGALMKCGHFAPAWSFPENHPLVAGALRGLQAEGIESRIGEKAGYGTSGHAYALQGIPTIAFGPSTKGLLHVNDEYIEIEQLYSALKGYCGIAAAILGA